MWLSTITNFKSFISKDYSYKGLIESYIIYVLCRCSIVCITRINFHKIENYDLNFSYTLTRPIFVFGPGRYTDVTINQISVINKLSENHPFHHELWKETSSLNTNSIHVIWHIWKLCICTRNNYIYKWNLYILLDTILTFLCVLKYSLTLCLNKELIVMNYHTIVNH